MLLIRTWLSRLPVRAGETPVLHYLWLLPVTRRTTRNVSHRSQIVFPYQIRAQRKLVSIDFAIEHHGLVGRGLFVAHIEHLIARPQVFLRRAMTLQTPLHLQRSVVEHQWHPVDRAVAGVATHALVDVNAVIEVNEIREVVDPRPY